MKGEKKLVRFDWAMKSILRHKANFDILEGFLTSLLREEITVENILESESNKDRAEGKNNRVDLKCKDSTGREIIIEVQAQYEYDYLQRILFGTSKAVVEHVSIGREYENIPKIISVNILYHPLLPEKNNDYIYHGRTEMTGLHTGDNLVVRLGSRQLPVPCGNIMPEYYFLCVGNFKSDRVQEKIDEWIYFFKTESISADFTAPGIREAERKLDYLKMSEREQKSYDAYMDALHYERSTLRTAIEEGELRGELIGELRGEIKGEIKGKTKVAMQMLSDGVPIENIARWTNLSEPEILELKQSIAK